MDLKTLLAEIAAEVKKPAKEISKLALMSKIMAAMALLEDPKTEVPSDAFDILDGEIRRLAMTLLLTTFISVLKRLT